MASEVVNRAAREVEDEYAVLFGKRCSTEKARRLVERVLVSLRETTDSMMRAANRECQECVGECWPAMIDEALRDG